MKKEYKPLNLVMNGRYAVLYGKLSPEEQEAVLQRFGPMFCRSDIINYGSLHNIDFKRTLTLCQGGQMCDFCFVRHRKGEVWERTKSI